MLSAASLTAVAACHLHDTNVPVSRSYSSTRRADGASDTVSAGLRFTAFLDRRLDHHAVPTSTVTRKSVPRFSVIETFPPNRSAPST